jgi:hypothetical protein
MSYARFSNSDIYIFFNGNVLECMGCNLAPPTVRSSHGSISFKANNTNKMIKHILDHKKIGHKVPEDIEINLLKDDERNFNVLK